VVPISIAVLKVPALFGCRSGVGDLLMDGAGVGDLWMDGAGEGDR